jgi:hypothetical protein
MGVILVFGIVTVVCIFGYINVRLDEKQQKAMSGIA